MDHASHAQGHWYVCPGLLSRLSKREFEIYYDRRDISVIYLFVEGKYVGEAYCQAFMGQRVSEWEAAAMRKHDREKAKAAATASVEGIRAEPSNFQTRRRIPDVMSNEPSLSSKHCWAKSSREPISPTR